MSEGSARQSYGPTLDHVLRFVGWTERLPAILPRDVVITSGLSTSDDPFYFIGQDERVSPCVLPPWPGETQTKAAVLSLPVLGGSSV